MPIRRTLVLFLLLAILGSNCKKDEPSPSTGPDGYIGGHPLNSLGLPFATTEGLNTMGCLINGEPWLPLKKNFVGDLVYHVPFSISGGGNLNVQGRRDFDDFDETLHLSGNPIIDPGEYGNDFINSIFINDMSTCGFFNMDSTFANQIVISQLDFENEIVSGTFEMRVVNENCDTLNITQGRFDLSSE